MINCTLKYACLGIFPGYVRSRRIRCDPYDEYLVETSLIQDDNVIRPNANTVIVNQVYSKCRCRKSKYLCIVDSNVVIRTPQNQGCYSRVGLQGHFIQSVSEGWDGCEHNAALFET